MASLVNGLGSNAFVSTPDRTVFGLFKKAGESHGDCSEPWHTKLAFAIHLERSNQTLIIVTTCEREGCGVLLICSHMIAAGSLLSESSE